MYYSKIYKTSILDGPGVRVSLYVSGCRNHCKGCHNKETWSFLFGKEYTEETEKLILDLLSRPYIKGFTLCGGEPMEEENQRELVKLLRKVKAQFPDKDIWCYTGYEYEDLSDTDGRKRCGVTDEILSYIDVLVAGPFVLAERDISDANRWRGSRNQRVINLKETLKEHKVIYVKGIPNNN